MTTKTGEKLRGRKRPKDVLAKAWETRRRNKKLRARQAADGPKVPRKRKASTGRKAIRSRSKLKGGFATQGALASGLSTIAAAARGDGPMTRTAPAAPIKNWSAPNKFEVMTEELLAVAGSNNRDAHREATQLTLRRMIGNESFVAEDAMCAHMRAVAAQRAINEMMADYVIYKRLRGAAPAPYLIGASAIDAIVDVLRPLGYSGESGGGRLREAAQALNRTVGSTEAELRR